MGFLLLLFNKGKPRTLSNASLSPLIPESPVPQEVERVLVGRFRACRRAEQSFQFSLLNRLAVPTYELPQPSHLPLRRADPELDSAGVHGPSCSSAPTWLALQAQGSISNSACLEPL